MDPVKQCFVENYLELGIHKIAVVSPSSKIYSIYFNYYLGYVLIFRTDCVKYLDIAVR
jgi:hypothetical protein